MKNVSLLLIVLLLVAPLLFSVAVSQSIPEWMESPITLEVNAETVVEIAPNGVARVEGVFKMSTSAYTMFKQFYSPLSTFLRQLKWGNSPSYIVNASVEADDANNLVRVKYTEMGVAEYLGENRWRIRIVTKEARDVRLVAQQDNTMVFMVTYEASEAMKLTETIRVILPSQAKNIVFNEEEPAIYYEMPLPGEHATSRTLRYAGSTLILGGMVILLLPIVAKRKRGYPEISLPPRPE